MVRAARLSNGEAIREALSGAMLPLVTSDGRLRLEDELRYLIAVA